VDRTDSAGRQPLRGWSPGPALAAFHDGVTVICEISAQFGDAGWIAPSPCPEWRVIDLAGHLRCVADDFHEYLDDAPASRLARLMARGAHPDTLARKLARQNAAELAALPDASGPEHIDAFASSARSYAQRLLPIWDLPHHQYRDVLVTVGGMAGAACAEWHLHAWDLARAQGKDYRPADPDMLLRGWRAGMPHLPLEGAGLPFRGYEAGRYEAGPYETGPYATGPYAAGPYAAGPYGTGPYETGPHGTRRYDRPGPDHAVAADVATARAAAAGPAVREDPWHVMLRASGRISLGRNPPGPVL
jgi:Mycothiol maleylpyruvate isomerase N-terminal domain